MERDFPDIGHRIVQLNTRKIARKGGKENLILLTIEDVSEQVEARRALEETEARFRKYVQEINSIIIELNSNGEVRFSNRFTVKLFGYSCDELMGKKNWSVLFCPSGTARERTMSGFSFGSPESGMFHIKDA